MADWYVSSVAYAAIPTFATAHAYVIGDIIRPTAPAFTAQYPYRCTTAGTSAGSEPTWGLANNSTTTSNTAIFTLVAGQSTYGWSAAAGTLYSIISGGGNTARPAAGDRVFLSSDHSESSSTATNYAVLSTAGWVGIRVISVSRAGSVPPVTADILAGAAISYTGGSTWILDCYQPIWWQGITFTLGGSSATLYCVNNGLKVNYFKDCAFVFTTSTTTAILSNNDPVRIVLDNTSVKFNAAGQKIQANATYGLDLTWINTATPLGGGTVPTVLLASAASVNPLVTLRGLDLSALTTTLFAAGNSNLAMKILLDSCRIASGLTRYSTGSIGASTTHVDEVELVNCYDGTNILSERYTPAGAVTTEFTITLAGGATDNVGTFSHKLVSSATVDKAAYPLDGFWMDTNYTTTGVSKTATVEIISSTALNTDEISLLLEYEGTAGSSLASFSSTYTPLSSSAVTTSTATWNSSPATPQKQKLQVTFTPQAAGRLRGLVRLGKASATVYVNPQITVT